MGISQLCVYGTVGYRYACERQCVPGNLHMNVHQYIAEDSGTCK